LCEFKIVGIFFNPYELSTVVDSDMRDALEEDRVEALKWAEGKLKNPKRSVLKPEPWEEVAEGKYKVKFSWKAEAKPPIVDTEGTPITDLDIPLYSGSQVKLAFYQKPYILKDATTYGTSLKLVGVQVISTAHAGASETELNDTDVAAMFGVTKGYKAGDPVTTNDDGDDF
jgi:hypothetical protein